jgi:hypothetical protein
MDDEVQQLAHLGLKLMLCHDGLLGVNGLYIRY